MNDAPAAPTAKPRDYKAEWARRKKRAAEKAKGAKPAKPAKYVQPSRAKPRSEMKNPNKAWTPAHLKNFRAAMKRRREAKAKGGTVWTPERRKKFMATVKAKQAAMANGTGPLGGKRIGRPRKDARPPDVWGMRPDGQEGWLTPILQQRWVYVPKPG